MDKPPTRRRQHRQALPRSASEPASKLSAVAGAGRHNQLSASLPASFTFAQNDREARHHLTNLLRAEEVKEHLQRFPGFGSGVSYKFQACRISVLSALVAVAAVLWFGGAGSMGGNNNPSTRRHVNLAQSTDSDDTIPTTPRRISTHNIAMPLNLETDSETEARILEEDRRNDMHMRRRHIFWDAAQRDKMIAERKRVKALWEKQNMPIQGRREKGVRRKTPT